VAPKPPPTTPASAKRELLALLALGTIQYNPRQIVDDVASVRRAYPEDADFADALRAVKQGLLDALRDPEGCGVATEHDLDGWRRSKFALRTGEEASLRLVFRPLANGKIRLLAFGHREFPDTVYYTAARRLRSKR